MGRLALSRLAAVGSFALTGFRSAAALGRSLLPGERFRLGAAVQQLQFVGVTATPIVMLIALAIGLIQPDLSELYKDVYVEAWGPYTGTSQPEIMNPSKDTNP